MDDWAAPYMDTDDEDESADVTVQPGFAKTNKPKPVKPKQEPKQKAKQQPQQSKPKQSEHSEPKQSEHSDPKQSEHSDPKQSEEAKPQYETGWDAGLGRAWRKALRKGRSLGPVEYSRYPEPDDTKSPHDAITCTFDDGMTIEVPHLTQGPGLKLSHGSSICIVSHPCPDCNK